MRDDAAIDNALVDQKNSLIVKMNEAGEFVYEQLAHTLTEVLVVLEYSITLWNALDYGYKGRELADRVSQLAFNRRVDLYRHPAKYAHLSRIMLRCDNLKVAFKVN